MYGYIVYCGSVLTQVQILPGRVGGGSTEEKRDNPGITGPFIIAAAVTQD